MFYHRATAILFIFMLTLTAAKVARADGNCACTSSTVVRPCHKNTFFISCPGGTALDIRQTSVPVQSGEQCAQACTGFGAEQIKKNEVKTCKSRPGQQIAVATTAVVVRMGIGNAFPDKNLEKGKYKLAFGVCPGKDDKESKDTKGGKSESRCKRGEVVNLAGTGCGKCVGPHKVVTDGRCRCAAGYKRKPNSADCVKK